MTKKSRPRKISRVCSQLCLIQATHSHRAPSLSTVGRQGPTVGFRELYLNCGPWTEWRLAKFVDIVRRTFCPDLRLNVLVVLPVFLASRTWPYCSRVAPRSGSELAPPQVALITPDSNHIIFFLDQPTIKNKHYQEPYYVSFAPLHEDESRRNLSVNVPITAHFGIKPIDPVVPMRRCI